MLTYVKDLGMIFATEKSTQRNHFAMYKCSGCNLDFRFQVSQIKAGYTHWCKTCGMKQENKNPLKKTMRVNSKSTVRKAD